MIDEIELFYKTLEAAVREEHAGYLKSQKRVPLVLDLPNVDDLPTGDAWKRLGFFERLRLKRRRKAQKKARSYAEKRQSQNMEDKLLKGYNAGIECALSVMSSEYEKFEKRLREASRQDGTL